MLDAGLPEVLSESRGRPAASMKRNDQAIDPRTLQRARDSGQLACRTGDRFRSGNQRCDAFREGP